MDTQKLIGYVLTIAKRCLDKNLIALRLYCQQLHIFPSVAYTFWSIQMD